MKSFYLLCEKIKSEEEKNVESTLKKIPQKHADLVRGFNLKFTPNNTLKNDKDHIGYIFKKDIVVAAPYNYGREFTLLHEIAHMVWEKLISEKIKKEWNKVYKKYKKELNQNPEEGFCMVYANFHVKHKLKTYDKHDLENFIKEKVISA